jgi:U2 small nuclear ribonucleoprotein B''
VQFSKQKSDIVAKKDGTFVPREKKRKFEAASAASAEASGARPAKAPKLMINSVPHKILFAQALPDDCTDQMLTMLFQQYPGFVEVRMVPGKKGIAFIEFQDVVPATMALQQLNGFKLADGEALHLTYGKQ